MKRWGRKMVASALCLTLALVSPSIALAASSAGSLDELAREVAKHGMNRETSFDIQYTGKESDIDKFFAEENLEFFYSRMSVQDDPTTSDDADYLIGNIDYTYKDFDYPYQDGILQFKMRYFETLDQTTYVNNDSPVNMSGMIICTQKPKPPIMTI